MSSGVRELRLRPLGVLGAKPPRTRKNLLFCKNKRGIKENSVGIEISKNMIRLGRAAKICKGAGGGGCFGFGSQTLVWAETSALKILYLFCKNNLSLGVF